MNIIVDMCDSVLCTCNKTFYMAYCIINYKDTQRNVYIGIMFLTIKRINAKFYSNFIIMQR